MKEIHRGNVYFVELGKQIGSVQSGIRPCVVIQNDKGNEYSPTIIVAPLTSSVKKMHMPTHVIMPATEGLFCNSMVVCEQIVTVSREQIRNFVCRISDDSMAKIDRAVGISIGLIELPKHHN